MKFSHIKLLTDENISPKVVAFFRQKGFDILDVKEQRWHGRTDAELLHIAYRERRVVMTHDSDFGELAVNQGKPFYGIAYIRLNNFKPAHVIEVCEKLLHLDIEVISGTILVIENTRIRIRYAAGGED